MSATQTAPAVRPSIRPAQPPVPAQRRKADPGRLFYPFAGVLMLLLTLVGFRLFFFSGMAHPGRPITPPIRTLVITHGLVMLAWILLFLAQPALIAVRRHKLHMTLGWVGAALATLVVVTGTTVALQSAGVTPAEVRIWSMPPKQFLSVPLVTVLLFAGFVGVAIWQRKRPAIHRTMLLCGTMAATGAAVSRIDPITRLYVGTPLEHWFGPFLGMLAVAVLLLGLRSALTRTLDRWLALGVGILILAGAGTMLVARTGAWNTFASALVG